LLVGLHYLKHAYNESDESVVEKRVEPPYWQYFYGYEYFQHKLPCHPTSSVKWRQRIKAKGVEKMLQEILSTAIRSEGLDTKYLLRVNVDTTVQEKAIAFPTDARLYEKACSVVITTFEFGTFPNNRRRAIHAELSRANRWRLCEWQWSAPMQRNSSESGTTQRPEMAV
jgi:hypothetical protein